jgi:Arc/MetJ family transcription regulator
MKTLVGIDDSLLKKAMELSRTGTKKKAIHPRKSVL